MKSSKRLQKHAKDNKLESYLKILEKLLNKIDLQAIKSLHVKFEYPTIFIMGCARSGTTLLSQFLASTNIFCYPTNLLSRFYYAPYIGSIIQKILVDLDTKEELLKSYDDIMFNSILGKTKGPLSPHEFWYYWYRYFTFSEIQQLSDEELDKVNIKEFLLGINSIKYVFDKPLFMKGMILNWHIPYLFKSIPNSYFLFIKRKTEYNAQSLLLSRREFFGNDKEWYSFKPPEFSLLSDKIPTEQVVGQVYYTNKAITTGLAQIPADRYIEIIYEDFCTNPNSLIKNLENKLYFKKFNHDQIKNIHFMNTNDIKVSSNDWNLIKDFSDNYTKELFYIDGNNS